MYYFKHIQVTLAFVFLTISVICLLPVVIITGRVGEYAPSDVAALYGSVVKDIYTK